ncbi:GAF domain-containing protein [Gemmatimonas groenlandica]|uniref:GAF domain-containing protein n=1 Tax=Gemmatimonas groenlandica TaxID=2732249 RepID=A0A6M4IPC5_9BACT|nr:GAF domain-containing protein [Gemmatimonas groenlandica]QJR35875.1 GAF domain-containing protein [Gemmatimonas groenlandica]
MSDARELLAVREIAHAFLLADRPSDVQQFALDRVTPILGAAFSLVMELGDDGELLRPVAQHEWPSKHRHWIGALRVRVGDGPSGVAVAERRLVEVADLFADASLGAWHEVASELGFRSIIAAPMETADGPIGAIAFYFADATPVRDEQRALVRVVADQLAAATDKSRRTDALRRANAALAEANAQLERQAAVWNSAERARDQTVHDVVSALLTLAAPGETADASMRLAAVHALAVAARDYDLVTRDDFSAAAADVDPREPLLSAVSTWRIRAPMVPIHVDEPTVLLPMIRGDLHWLSRLLELVVGLAVRSACMEGGTVNTGVRLGRGFIALQVGWRDASMDAVADQPPSVPSRILQETLRRPAHDPFAGVRGAVTALDQPLATVLAGRLGGQMRVEQSASGSEDEGGWTLVFPVEVDL